MSAIYTVGHSRHSLDELISLLQPHGVTRVIDVRSRPYSRWAPEYVKRSLERSLPAKGIAYEFRGAELGGLIGALSYDERAVEEDFVAAIDELVERAPGETMALMCAEEDPARCHRKLLLTPALRARGVEVIHVRGGGEVEVDGAERQLDLFGD